MPDQVIGPLEGWRRRSLQEALDRSFAVRVRQRRPMTVAKTPTGLLFESDADWDGVRAGEVAREGTVLLSPSDITKRRHAMKWANRLRPYHRLAPESLHAPPINPQFAAGARVLGDIVPAQLTLPLRCCTCLEPPTHALILEGLLPALGEPNWSYELAEPGSVEARREGECQEVAGKRRVWCAVPSCAAHVTAPTPATLDVSALGKMWISFRNERYGSEFAEMNGLRTHHPVCHNLLVPILFVPLLLSIGVLAWQGGAFVLAVAMLTVPLGGILWMLGRMPLHRSRANRGSPTVPRSGRHEDLPPQS